VAQAAAVAGIVGVEAAGYEFTPGGGVVVGVPGWGEALPGVAVVWFGADAERVAE
jgi:hypothetical protein